MAYQEKKEPLYRKENTKARNHHHRVGGDYRHERHTKAAKESEEFEETHLSMHGKKQRGLDYTPLYRFLISKVGKEWTKIHSEAVSRLDKSEPIYYLVAQHDDEKSDYVRIGDNSYYSGLYIDENNILQKVNPNFTAHHLEEHFRDVMCDCCTYSFNGQTLKHLPNLSEDSQRSSKIKP